MDYEKKYIEALEQAKELLDSPRTCFDIAQLKDIFPELTESEDERMLREFNDYLCEEIEARTNDIRNEKDRRTLNMLCYVLKKVDAWLEKQKEQKPRLIGEDSVEKMARQMYETGQTIEEQKPVLTAKEAWKEMRLEVYAQASGNRHEPNCSDDSTKMFSLCDIDEIIEKIDDSIVEQKPVSKFSVGDYVIDTNYKGEPLYQIVGTDKECYICEYRGDKEMGDRAVMHFAFDNPYLRLKQKPVELSDNFEENIRILLVDKLTQRSKDGSISSAVFIDDRTLKDICAGIWFYVGKEVLKYPNKELNVSEWSEEDEKKLNHILQIVHIAHGREVSVEEKEELEKFLKSLRPQPKVEWNKQDVDMLNWLIRCCEKEHEELCNDKYGHQDIISDLKRDCRKKWDWLESLKNKVVPQSHWKPSEEQMKALERTIRLANFGLEEDRRKALESLYEHLKKL